MYVCMYVCMSVRMYLCTHIFYACNTLPSHKVMFVCVYVCLYLCMYACLTDKLPSRMVMCICTCVCIYSIKKMFRMYAYMCMHLYNSLCCQPTHHILITFVYMFTYIDTKILKWGPKPKLWKPSIIHTHTHRHTDAYIHGYICTCIHWHARTSLFICIIASEWHIIYSQYTHIYIHTHKHTEVLTRSPRQSAYSHTGQTLHTHAQLPSLQRASVAVHMTMVKN
jgi:hypothetical protein